MTETLRVLVVDDERVIRATTGRQLEARGYAVATCGSAFEALEQLREDAWDVVITDMRMPRMSGIELLTRIRDEGIDSDVIVVTAFGSVASAVEAMNRGAADYLSKPFTIEELDARLEQIKSQRSLRRELVALRKRLDAAESSTTLVGKCQPMRLIRDRIRLFAPHDAPVLITGETGTGKAVVAGEIHRNSMRKDRPLVVVGCGSIVEGLAESALFGHARGAFTGATSARQGHFETAHRGTIVLDDIDDLPMSIQPKLLRLLQEGTFIRVGSSREIAVDVRVIATTKVSLKDAVAQSVFRSDLYYRLRGLEIELPALRERAGDVLLLAEHFLHQLRGSGEARPRLSTDAARSLQAHDWPGNVRELRRTMESAAVLSGGHSIRPDHLPSEMSRLRSEDTASRPYDLRLDGCERLVMPDVLRSLESDLVSWALEKSGGTIAGAAELLGVPRTTLQSKVGAGGSKPSQGEGG